MLSPSVHQIRKLPLLICNRMSASQHFSGKLKTDSKKRGLYLQSLENSAFSPVVQLNCCFTEDLCQIISQYDSYSPSNPPKLANISGKGEV